MFEKRAVRRTLAHKKTERDQSVTKTKTNTDDCVDLFCDAPAWRTAGDDTRQAARRLHAPRHLPGTIVGAALPILPQGICDPPSLPSLQGMALLPSLLILQGMTLLLF